jgi:hypothetical protein
MMLSGNGGTGIPALMLYPETKEKPALSVSVVAHEMATVKSSDLLKTQQIPITANNLRRKALSAPPILLN